MLDLKAALDLLNTGQWVSIAYVGADERRGRFGEIIRIKRCRLHLSLNNDSKKSKPTISAVKPNAISKNPEHGTHFTRNVILSNGQIRKLHFRFLFMINGQKVI